MKKQAISSQNALSSSQVAALLTPLEAEQQTISLPLGVSTTTNNSALTQFLSAQTPHLTDNHKTKPQQKELSFGAPQLDLALPKGTLQKNTLHTFHPKQWRDQQATLACALSLAIRNQKQTETEQTAHPIFCFLIDDQTQLIEWINKEVTSLNISPKDLILITCKHSDDLLWAIEETMHKAPNSTIVTHFNLLQNIAAQRLKVIAQSQSCTCLLVCNHKIEGPNHAHSNWTVSQAENNENAPLKITLEHKSATADLSEQHHILEWQAKKHRFKTANLKSPQTAPTLH